MQDGRRPQQQEIDREKIEQIDRPQERGARRAPVAKKRGDSAPRRRRRGAKTRRFRQAEQQRRRKEKRRSAAGDEDRRPTESPDELARHKSRKREADRNSERREKHEPPPRDRGREIGGQRDRQRNAAAEAEARQEPGRRQLRRRLNKGRDEREDAERRHADDHDRLAPEPIAEQTRDQRAKQEADIARRQRGRERSRRDAPGIDEQGDNIAHGGDVVAFDQQDRCAETRHAEASRGCGDGWGFNGVHRDHADRLNRNLVMGV